MKHASVLRTGGHAGLSPCNLWTVTVISDTLVGARCAASSPTSPAYSPVADSPTPPPPPAGAGGGGGASGASEAYSPVRDGGGGGDTAMG